MHLREVLLAEHAMIHSAAVATTPETQLAEVVWARLDEAQKRQVLPGHCSVAWLWWHLARWEDVQVNCLIRGVQEVLDDGAWLGRLNLDARDAGTGAPDEEVADLSARVSLTPLKEYRDAVGNRTRQWLQEVDLGQLATVVDVAERVARVPAFIDRERAGWVLARDKRTVASLWIWPVIGHAFAHLGEASHVTRSLGIPGR